MLSNPWGRGALLVALSFVVALTVAPAVQAATLTRRQATAAIHQSTLKDYAKAWEDCWPSNPKPRAITWNCRWRGLTSSGRELCRGETKVQGVSEGILLTPSWNSGRNCVPY